MLDFLTNVGISDNTIKKMQEIYSEPIIFNLSNNDVDCIKIIEYMKSIGIYNIDNLLLERIDIFKMSFDRFKKLMEKHYNSEFIQSINEDSTEIEEIFN